jgi:hypothetical protein
MTSLLPPCRRFGFAITSSFCVLIASPVGAVAGEQASKLLQNADTPSPKFWRDARHGGLNALYVLIRLYGYQGRYEHLLAMAPGSEPPNTLADLLSTAVKSGYALTARRLAPDDLGHVPLPAIVHVDGDDPAAGTFLLLLIVRDKELICFNGASATIVSISRERFLRSWSGICLYPNVRAGWFTEILLGAVIGLSFGCCCTWRFFHA